jgi:hypothetical protein
MYLGRRSTSCYKKKVVVTLLKIAKYCPRTTFKLNFSNQFASGYWIILCNLQEGIGCPNEMVTPDGYLFDRVLGGVSTNDLSIHFYFARPLGEL